MAGGSVDVRAVVDPAATDTSGVAHARALVAFADAVVGEDDAELAQARATVLAEIGAEPFIDAAAVAANFERMVRVADATGIPLDGTLDALSQDLRVALGLDRWRTRDRV